MTRINTSLQAILEQGQTMMSDKATILFVDDEEAIVDTLRASFRREYDVITTTDPNAALTIVNERPVHVLVADQRMPHMRGIELLSKVREVSPNTIRILLTGFSDLAAIVGSVNDGQVFRFISKPWNHQEIKAIIAQAAAIGLRTANVSAKSGQQSTDEAIDRRNQNHHLLVIDDDMATSQILKKLFTGSHEVHGVANVRQALEVLNESDISVIVSELQVSGEDTRPFLRVLKRRYPLIQSVLATKFVDSDDIIKLINQAQIYRFTSKPVSHGALRLSVNAALRQHLKYAENPELLVSQQVEEVQADESKSSLVANVMKSLRGLSNRLSLVRSH